MAKLIVLVHKKSHCYGRLSEPNIIVSFDKIKKPIHFCLVLFSSIISYSHSAQNKNGLFFFLKFFLTKTTLLSRPVLSGKAIYATSI